MDRILIILTKENGPRASSAPALGLNTIIFKHVYWYMQQISGECLVLWFLPILLFFFQKNKGRFLHCDIPVIWKDYSEELRPWLLRLTEDFDLTFPLPKQPINIVPCLLPGEEPEDVSFVLVIAPC